MTTAKKAHAERVRRWVETRPRSVRIPNGRPDKHAVGGTGGRGRRRSDMSRTVSTDPDFFGDTRTHAAKGTARLIMVFDVIGKLSGGYLHDEAGKSWHTVRVGDVQNWIAS